MKRVHLIAAAVLALVSSQAQAAGYVGLVQADGVTPVGPASPLYTGGNVADAAADSGSPVKIGCIVYSAGTLPTYSGGQRANAQCDTHGHLQVNVTGPQVAGSSGLANNVVGFGALDGAATNTFPGMASPMLFNGTTLDQQPGNTTGAAVLPGGLPAKRWSFASATGGIVNTTTAVTIKTAAGAGVRNCISSLQVAHDALGGATEAALRDGAAGTVIWRGKLQTTATEGYAATFDAPICGTANTLMEFVTLTAVTGGVFPNAQGYVSP